MKAIVTISRILTGALFIFSGLVKAIDPRGLAYKMQEFFEVFAREGYMPSLMDALSNQALPFSITMITLEVVLGVALLIGWQRKLTVWLLLLLMLLFTFLTSYVLFSGKIEACGCFGDCIPITPLQTFTKDVILLLLVLILLFNQRQIHPLNKPLILTMVILTALAATLALQFYVLNHLPTVDCLPFKKGNNILELRKLPADAVADEYSYSFIYEKNGKRKEFSTAELPDSTWVFSERKQKLVKKGKNNVPKINDFKLNNADGIDSTEAILSNPQLYYILFLEFPSKHTDKWIEDFKSFTTSQKNKSKVYVVTSQRGAAENLLAQHNISVDGVLTSDATAIKTAARSNPTLYSFAGPVVKDKWGWAAFEEIHE